MGGCLARRKTCDLHGGREGDGRGDRETGLEPQIPSCHPAECHCGCLALNASVETDLNLVIRGELTTTCEQRSGVKPLYSLRNTLAVGLQYGLGRGGGHGAC